MRTSKPITVTLGKQQPSIDRRLASGQYDSASEVMRAALRALDREEALIYQVMREGIRASLTDPRPDIPAEDVFERLRTQRKTQAMTKTKIEAYESSGNVFADLDLPDAEGLSLKSDIVIELHRLVKARGLTQVKAAKQLGISQPDLSDLLRGRFERYSAERLMKMLTVFEQDIEIVMKPHRKAGEAGRITFKPVAV